VSANATALAYLTASVLFILALKGLSSPESARRGNLLGMLGMAVAVAATLLLPSVASYLPIVGMVVVGGAARAVVARRIPMTSMPELVAAMHSLVGLAAVLIAVAAFLNPAEYGIATAAGDIAVGSRVEMVIGALVGAITFTGSVVAFGKLKGTFGSVLVTVGKIEPGEQKTFEEVKPQIKREIAESRAKNKIGDLRDKIEDAKASGATLAEAAAKLALKSRAIEAVDRSGRAPNGNPVADLPRQPDVVNAAFNSDVGVDNEALQLPGGGYLYYDVTGVTPSRERPLDEVKDKVAQRWRDDEITKRLKSKADDMVARLKGGATLEQLAGEAGVQVQKAGDLHRGKAAGFVPENVVQAVFATPKGEIGSAQGKQETAHYVFRVTGVSNTKLDPKSDEAKAIAGSLKNAYADDLIGEYVTHLEKEFGVEINQSALNQIIGGEPGG